MMIYTVSYAFRSLLIGSFIPSPFHSTNIYSIHTMCRELFSSLGIYQQTVQKETIIVLVKTNCSVGREIIKRKTVNHIAGWKV